MGSEAEPTGVLLRSLTALEVILVVALVPSGFMHPLVAPLLFATWLVVHSLRSAILKGALGSRVFVLAFGFGNLGSMVYANAGYVLFTNFPQYGDHTDSMWLTNGLVAAALAGCTVVEWMLPARKPRFAVEADSATGWEALAVTGFLYLGATVLTFTAAGNTRWNPEEITGATTVAIGTGRIADLFFFVLGYQLVTPFMQTRNLVLVAAGVLLSLGNGLLRGYREPAMMSLITFAIGAMLKSQQLPRLRTPLLAIGACMVPVVLIYMEAIGAVRSEFANEGLGERISLTGDEIAGASGGAAGMEDDSSLFSRFFEPAGQDVIARVKASGYRAGFEHFERLAYVMVPMFLAPEKQSPEVGPEVLARDFHYYHLTENSSVPMTLVADCYRRGGWLWELVVGFLLGLWLRWQLNLTRLIARGPMLSATIVAIAVRYLRVYPYTVTGAISATTWYWIKEAAMFTAAGLLITILRFLARPRRARPRAGLAAP